MNDIYISGNRNSNGEVFRVNLPPDADFQQPQYPQPEDNNGKKKKTRRKKSFLRRVISLIVTVAIIVSAVYIGLCGFFTSLDYNKTDLEKNEYISSSQLASDKGVINLLLLGVDRKGNEKASRSDTMLLLSVDMSDRKLKLTSFLRDMWVEIPGHGGAKLNAACTYGGPQLVVDTIEYNFNVDIDDYVLVDFKIFTEIVDRLGGVEVDISEKEAKFINRTTRYTVESGENIHLDGNEALVYARIRKLDSDFYRTARQRKLITAIVNKANETGIFELFGIVSDVVTLLETSLDETDLARLSLVGAVAIFTFDIEQLNIPQDDMYSNKTVNGQSALVADMEANRDALHDFIY